MRGPPTSALDRLIDRHREAAVNLHHVDGSDRRRRRLGPPSGPLRTVPAPPRRPSRWMDRSRWRARPMERLAHRLLFSWSVDLASTVRSGATGFPRRTATAPRQGEVAAKLPRAVLGRPRVGRPLSGERFSLDGAPIQAWDSAKGLDAEDGSGEPPGPGRHGERRFLGERRAKETRASRRFRGAALPRGRGQGGSALVQGPRRGGEPARADRGRPDERG